MGQLRPGDQVRFKQVNYEYALSALKAENALLQGHFDEFDQLLQIPNIEANEIDPIFKVIEAKSNGQPKVSFRLSGDQHVLVELEMQQFEIENRFYIEFIISQLNGKCKHEGILEMVPGVSSLLIKYNPFKIFARDLADLVAEKCMPNDLASVNEMVISCRSVKLPLAFRDRWNKEAIERYMNTISNKVPYLPDNCEFIRKINDLDSLETLSRILEDTTYVVLGLGDVYLGAPCAVPFDPVGLHRFIFY